MLCIVLQLLAGVGRFVVPPHYAVYFLIVASVVVLASTVSVFLLAIKVFNIPLGIVYAIGALLPCLGLLVLLLVNQKATQILRDNGHEVGFLGADLSKF
jgi:hypothetical protein